VLSRVFSKMQPFFRLRVIAKQISMSFIMKVLKLKNVQAGEHYKFFNENQDCSPHSHLRKAFLTDGAGLYTLHGGGSINSFIFGELPSSCKNSWGG
jgi:hypothetical protein